MVTVVDALRAIADLKAAGMPEGQARVLVRVLQEAGARSPHRCTEAALSREALQEQIRQFGLEVTRRIDSESRFYVACVVGIYAAMFVALKLIP